VSIKEDGKIDASLKESVVLHGFDLNLESLAVGMILTGVVNSYLKGKASVTIEGCRFRGTIALKDFKGAKDGQYIEQAIPVGTVIKAKLIKLQKEPKIKIKLGNLDRHFDGLAEEPALDVAKERE